MRFLKLSLILLCLAGSLNLRAEEGEGGGKAADNENKEQKEYGEKTTKLNTLNTKVEEADKRLKDLTKEKAEAKSPAEKQRIIGEMNTAVSDRNKAFDEYNKLKTEIILRYPNQGVASQPKKNSVEHKAGEEELHTDKKAATFEDQLKRTKEIVDKKFAPFNPHPEKAAKTDAGPTAAPKPAEPLKLER